MIQNIACLCETQKNPLLERKSKKHPPKLCSSDSRAPGEHFSWSCKCPGKDEMFCQSHGLHHVFKNMLISSSRCDLSFLFLCFVFEVADCFQRQTEFQSSHLLLVPGPGAYFLKNTVVFLQTNWGEAKLNSKHVPLVLLLLFTPGVNRDPPRNSLCSVQAF